MYFGLSEQYGLDQSVRYRIEDVAHGRIMWWLYAIILGLQMTQITKICLKISLIHGLICQLCRYIASKQSIFLLRFTYRYTKNSRPKFVWWWNWGVKIDDRKNWGRRHARVSHGILKWEKISDISSLGTYLFISVNDYH